MIIKSHAFDSQPLAGHPTVNHGMQFVPEGLVSNDTKTDAGFRQGQYDSEGSKGNPELYQSNRSLPEGAGPETSNQASAGFWPYLGKFNFGTRGSGRIHRLYNSMKDE
jgi:hypothetical protein